MKHGFTLAERNCQFAHSVRKFGRVEDAQYNYKAFTLAEILITLAIIGIVSALVIPSVLKNYNDRKYNTARLKALKTFGEAGKLASINGEINGQPSARAFVERVLSKYLKITKVCDTAEDCNFPSKIQPLNSDSEKEISDNLKNWNSLSPDISTVRKWTKTKDDNYSIYLSTNDGFSAKIFYNPKCIANTHENPGDLSCNTKECWTMLLDEVCMNAIYDMNGAMGPNHVGKDIGIVTIFWSGIKATSVAPNVIGINSFTYAGYNKSTYFEAQNLCASNGVKGFSYSLPSIDELSSLILNRKLTSLFLGRMWSGSLFDSENAWLTFDTYGTRGLDDINNKYYFWCIRR